MPSGAGGLILGCMPAILVTGCAGFIGYHLCARLLRQGFEVVGVDSLNDYYDPQLKRDRLAQLPGQGFRFQQLDLSDAEATRNLFSRYPFRRVVHLAAQPGVRYCKVNPNAYMAANGEGFLNVLEGCRQQQIEHLLYASSSSVYGANQKLPFSTDDMTDQPVSLYGATKKFNELMAHSYSRMFGLATTGLRLFTVYGPWGRPDMALYLFANAILEGRPIELYNYGEIERDFTYVDDVVEALMRLIPLVPSASGGAAARILNVGSHSPVRLGGFLHLIEQELGRKAQVRLAPLQTGEVVATYADIGPLLELTQFQPATPLREGIRLSMAWLLERKGLTAGVTPS